jgi:hypothetical protein
LFWAKNLNENFVLVFLREERGEEGEWEGGGRTKKKGTRVSSSPPFVPFSLFSHIFCTEQQCYKCLFILFSLMSLSRRSLQNTNVTSDPSIWLPAIISEAEKLDTFCKALASNPSNHKWLQHYYSSAEESSNLSTSFEETIWKTLDKVIAKVVAIFPGRDIIANLPCVLIVDSI